MLKKLLPALAVTLSMFAAPAAFAQSGDVGPQNSGSLTDTNPTPTTRATPSRLRRQERPRTAAPAAPTPQQVLAAAQEQATLANTNCQVSEAKLLGLTAEHTAVYEVACAAGPGFIIESKTPPTATDCIILAYSAERRHAADPSSDGGVKCALPANADTQKFVRDYAQQAGVPCTVDQTKVMGQSNDGAVVYEIGCSDAAGYWIRKEAGAWTKTPCIQVIAENGTCDFTSTAENAGYVKTLLAGSAAEPCNVVEARLMGRNANGVFYEAKCQGADGLIARLNAENAVQQIYPCATAQQIGGGCTLTPAPAAAAPSGGRP